MRKSCPAEWVTTLDLTFNSTPIVLKHCEGLPRNSHFRWMLSTPSTRTSLGTAFNFVASHERVSRFSCLRQTFRILSLPELSLLHRFNGFLLSTHLFENFIWSSCSLILTGILLHDVLSDALIDSCATLFRVESERSAERGWMWLFQNVLGETDLDINNSEGRFEWMRNLVHFYARSATNWRRLVRESRAI